jgi:UDP-N-acetylglucosamine--N-acetylmuramyl-(pentapeptide) pyrophosphoryl-undecaprenol N-acetylglucosamine transferase
VPSLLVASTGGHLAELYRLVRRLPPATDGEVWVTNDSVQSRSLLRQQPVLFLPYKGSRDLAGVAANSVRAAALLRRHQPHRIVSTGSGIALSFLPLARAMGTTCHYIESGTRVHGPSLTGALLARLPGIHCYTQHPEWTDTRWHCGGSVLDGFHVSPLRRPLAISRAVVTLGTWQQPFRRLVERLVRIIPRDVETLWQTGFTDVAGLPIDARPWVPQNQLSVAMAEADVVITHAGMGTVLDALDARRLPIVVPRQAHLGEQIDDHQVDLASALARRGLALARLPQELTGEDILEAARYRVARLRPLPDFALVQ